MRAQLVKDVVRNSVIVSSLTALGIVMMLVVDLATAAYYGTRPAADALFIASTVPNLIVGSLLTTVQVVMVPIMVNALHRYAPDQAARLISAIINVGIVAWVVIAGAASLLSPLIVPLIAPGASATVQAEAIDLGQTLFWLLPLTWLTESLKAGLNSQSRFAVAAAMPFVSNVIAVGIIVGLVGSIGIWAIVAGYLARALIPIPVLFLAYRAGGGAYHITLGRSEATEVKAAFRLVGLRFGTILLRDSDTLLERLLASFAPAGAIAALSYAQRASVGLESIVAGGTQAAIMPDLSRLATLQQTEAQQRLIGAGVKLVWLVTLPLVGICVALNSPITTLLFVRGQFDAGAASSTALFFSLYLLGTPFSALVRIALAVFYARRDARTPAVHMLVMLIVNSLLLITLFPMTGAAAIPLAASLTYVVSLARSLWLLGRARLQPLDVRATTLKVIAATVIAGLGATLLYALWDSAGASFIVRAMWLGIVSVLGLSGYLALLIGFRTAEAQQVVAGVRRRATAWLRIG